MFDADAPLLADLLSGSHAPNPPAAVAPLDPKPKLAEFTVEGLLTTERRIRVVTPVKQTPLIKLAMPPVEPPKPPLYELYCAADRVRYTHRDPAHLKRYVAARNAAARNALYANAVQALETRQIVSPFVQYAPMANAGFGRACVGRS